MDDELTPARAIPVEQILRKELKSRGWREEEFDELLQLEGVLDVLQGKPMTPATAHNLSLLLGISEEFWLSLSRHESIGCQLPRFGQCCCVCKNHHRLVSHPHTSGTYSMVQVGHVCAPEGFMKEGWVSEIPEHGQCEMWGIRLIL